MSPINQTKVLFIISCLLLNTITNAQDLETIYINEQVSTHFITSEPIEYVDISSDDIIGDLPVANILRLKPEKQESNQNQAQGIVTIVCQSYMVQYELKSGNIHTATKSKFVSSDDGKGLLLPGVTISAEEMKDLSKQILNQKSKRPIQQAKVKGLKMKLNKVYVYGDFYFLDITIQNHSHVSYEIEQMLFSVSDKKVMKASNYQEITLDPVFKLYTQNRIRRSYRNVFVINKFTFPSEKVFRIRVTEKQISGRTIQLEIAYQQIQETEPI